jgi:hypothetical protein
MLLSSLDTFPEAPLRNAAFCFEEYLVIDAALKKLCHWHLKLHSRHTINGKCYSNYFNYCALFLKCLYSSS